MSFYGVEYKFVQHEKFDDFLKSIGISEDKIALMAQYKPTQKFTKNGDTYTLTYTYPSGPKDTTFKSGVEFDDTFGEDNTAIYTIALTSSCLPTLPPQRVYNITKSTGYHGMDTVRLEIKNLYTVDGNTITQVIKSGLGQATFKREFNGDELVVTITSDKFDGVAKRYYKA